MTRPHALSPEQARRYQRQLIVPEIGEAGQLRLLDAKVLLVGAGGLGSPAALYLAAAGVGKLGVVDCDTVDESNLQRQVLHTTDRVGLPKTESATKTLLALNPGVEVDAMQARLNAENVDELIAGWDVVIDGSDNFATRYLVNDTCVDLGVPLVHGSVHRFEGQVTVFHPPHGPCYRCLYPNPPPAEVTPSSANAGLLGVLPGVVGVLQATEAIKLILGLGEPLLGRLLHYDVLQSEFRTLTLARNLNCASCAR